MRLSHSYSSPTCSGLDERYGGEAMTTITPEELSAALGWPGGISTPVLDKTELLQMVAQGRTQQEPVDPIVHLSGLHITGGTGNAALAMSADNRTMTIDSSAKIRLGSIVLTEELFLRMEAALEFVERFARENDEARALWTAVQVRRKILPRPTEIGGGKP